jgi:hypothetical protein
MKIINIFFSGLGMTALILTLTHPAHAQNNVCPTAPYIVKDTDNDSPGTNIVTRVVTIKAEVGGTPPVALQWKLDKGHGFEDIPGATNATYRIGNAQISDAGFYSLFATNAAGHINTTPVPLIVSEGTD